jgi:hypothetical protein
MKAYKLILVTLASLAALAGCAKKDNGFASRYAKNAFGASANNPEMVGQAIQNAGFTMDILFIRSVRTQSMATDIYATVMVNEQSHQVILSFNSTNINRIISSPTMAMIGGKQVRVEGKCLNVECSPAYIVATAYEGNNINVPRLQVGYKFMSALPTADQDKYHLLGPGQISTFDAMASYLN